MHAVGSAVYWHRYTDSGEIEKVPAVVTAEFYEPGDPVPGYNLVLETGKPVGGIDGQDLTPRKD